MMRFKDFLLESDDEELDDLIEVVKKCKKNLELVATKKQLAAWRGDEDAHQLVKLPESEGVSYLVRGPRTSPRKSLAGSDAAMAYVTNNWPEMPRRAYSNFGTFNRKFADDTFNNACWIIPFDNVKKFATSSVDFNFWAEQPDKRAVHQLLSTLKSFVSHGPFSRVLGVTEHEGPVTKAVMKLAEPYEDHFTLFRYSNTLSDALDDPKHQPAALEFLQRLMEMEPKLTAMAAKLELPPTGKFGKEPDDRLTINREKNLASKIEDYMGQVAHATHGNIIEFLEANFTPKTFEVEIVNSYAELPRYTKTNSEFWFEGSYLSIDGYDPNYLDASECVRVAGELLKLLKVKR